MTQVRFDDLSGLAGRPPRSWEMHGLTASGRAETIAEVIPTLAAFEAHCAATQDWGVFILAYEAAAAFDPAMRTKAQPPTGTPFVWWATFAERRRVEVLAARPSAVANRVRAANLMPYPDAVGEIRHRIELGDVFQVNHTDRFTGSYNGEALDLYAGLVGVQSCSHGAYIDMGTAVVASASPELFFEVARDSTISCRPMKGTAARHPRTAEDQAVGEALLSSEKDRAENVMIVDLLRNDVSRIAILGSVRVPELFRLERYETVWQLTSTVTASLPTDTGLVAILSALFPCGSITGAPKIAAMAVINELEADARGVYCGAIGVLAPDSAIDAPRLSVSVPIRTAVIDPVAHTFVYGAGGGITWSSDAQSEDAEVRTKAQILNRSKRTFDLLETMLLDAAGIRHAELHLDRLSATADWFNRPMQRGDIEHALASLAAPPQAQRLRLLLGEAGTFAIVLAPLDDSASPVCLAIDTDHITRSDDPFCCHKTTFRVHYEEARRRHPDADDVVMVNEFGHAIETTVANLAYRIGPDWFVPPLADGGLAGIGRQTALADRRVSERSILAADLATCDEVAVVNDVRGWRPATIQVL